MTAPPTGFTSRTLTQQMADTLVGEILTRRIPPGTRLRETELAARFGASRPAVREALHLLRSTGLVDDAPWKGVRVVALSREELIDLNDLRGLVFGFTVRRAAERARPADHARLAEALALMQACAADAGPDAYEWRRRQLHMLLAEVAGGASVPGRRRSFVERLDHAWEIESIRTPAQRTGSLARWHELLALIAAGDGPAAERLAHTMNDGAAAAELEAFDREGKTP